MPACGRDDSSSAGRVVIIGVGGASCSGKTILAKHLRSVLPGSLLVHQDDFAPPEEQLPFSTDEPRVRDWDDPATAILWSQFRSTLAHIRQHGSLPDDYRSHDHLNEQVEVTVAAEVKSEWESRLHREDITWVIVDGFVLYWDEVISKNLDVQLLLRVPRDVLKRRREDRQTYVTQTGDVWSDPPDYFPRIVWPAYVKAHRHLFEDGDVEGGSPLAPLELVQPVDGDMTDAFAVACERILAYTQGIPL